jgi:hypothetical protein
MSTPHRQSEPNTGVRKSAAALAISLVLYGGFLGWLIYLAFRLNY